MGPFHSCLQNRVRISSSSARDCFMGARDVSEGLLGVRIGTQRASGAVVDKVPVLGGQEKPALQENVGLFQQMPRRKRFCLKEEKERVACSIF